MDITIHRNGETYGPYSLDQIKEYLENGTLNENDLAWHDRSTEWLALKDVLRQVAPPPPSLQSTSQQELPPPLAVVNPTATNQDVKSVSDKKPLSVGKKVGLVVAILAVLAVLFVLFLFVLGSSQQVEHPFSTISSHLDGQPDTPAKVIGVYQYDSGNQVYDIITLFDDGSFTYDDPDYIFKHDGGRYTIDANKNIFFDGSKATVFSSHGQINDSSIDIGGETFFKTSGSGPAAAPADNSAQPVPSASNTNPDSTISDKATTTGINLFNGKWHFVIQGDDNSPTLCTNIISDGENIEVDAWVPNNGKTITVEGKLSVSQQQMDGVLCDIATFQEQGEKASFLLHSPNGTYAFSYRASGFHVLSPGLMQSPSTQDNSSQTNNQTPDTGDVRLLLIGTWAYSFDQDGSTTTIRLAFRPDGTYELSCPGNGGDSSSHGTWHIRGNGTVSLDELVGDSTVPVSGDECSLPKDGEIQLNTSHLQKNIVLKKE